MFNYISNNIADYFVKHNAVKEEDRDVIRYGVEISLSTLTSFILVLIIGFFTGCFLEGIVFLCMLMLVKKNTGGYHANSYLTCNLFTVSIFIINLLLYKAFEFMPAVICFLVGTASCMLIAFYAPCEHINHPLTPARKQKLKKISIFVSMLVLLFAFLLFILKFKIYIFIILVLTTICINLIVGLKAESRRNKK